jgi:hypothetical protein
LAGNRVGGIRTFDVCYGFAGNFQDHNEALEKTRARAREWTQGTIMNTNEHAGRAAAEGGAQKWLRQR